MPADKRRIKWLRPSAQLSTLALDSPGVAATVDGSPRRALSPSRRRQLAVLATVGVPIPEQPITTREYALDLLRLAAEVEHALMVQYLYIASSIVDDETAEENYPRKIHNVAIQEMGHFATVQNLMLLLGGPNAVHVQRDVLRARSDKNPIPFVLEPLTLTALAKYVAAEMPVDAPPELAEQVKRLVDIARNDMAKHGVQLEPHRVGAIYTVLEWLFMDEEEAVRLMNLTALIPELAQYGHLTDVDLQPADQFEPFQAEKEEWGGADFPSLLVLPARTRKEAVQSISQIAEQGEGFEGDPDSHFHEFIEMVDAFEKNMIKVNLIATSPDLGMGHGGEWPTPMTSAFTRLWGSVLSLQYTLIVLSVRHAIVTPHGTADDPGLRRKIIDLALRGMRRFVGSVSDILVSLPMREGEAELAGPPFDLDPADIDGDVKVLPARHLELLDRLATLYAEIEQDAKFSGNPGYRTALVNLRNFDKQRRHLFEALPVG